MHYQLIILAILALVSVTKQQTFDIATVPIRVQSYCSSKMAVRGTCRATFNRYTFNQATNECEHLVFGGCGTTRNIFLTREECERDCKRTETQMRALRSSSQSCTFQVNLGRDCSINNPSDIGLCLNYSPTNLTQHSCLSFGCCWDSILRICYQKASQTVETHCQIKYADEFGFYGKLNFQGDRRYPSGWSGQLSFSRSVAGGFCLLRDQVEPSGIQVSSTTMNDRRFFFLHGTQPVYEGHNVAVLFSGSYGNANFNHQRCSQLNYP
uniref:Kunitz-type protease inhibitor 1-like n=1 Tax=Ciona intestinalis TaxID=7719 RepID=A0A1W2WLF6_CIOIN|nr:kunitz-type protease inhibitor 1-like isoform X1 [Ciona intestinalis]XP_018667426.1 kunitz-type protease inhibitor 1-like isoform X3 [Ciona intestinalis]XP_026690343.1 kunitz-type protease inhibitor 1-like isoform X2 [Ciona intestinalis]|eukprot:XP_002129651.1 kunitz-type protease inhibitor 1-like isoform X1 [Ciona intestinalis]